MYGSPLIHINNIRKIQILPFQLQRLGDGSQVNLGVVDERDVVGRRLDFHADVLASEII